MDIKQATETIELPSKGLFYAESNPLSKGEVEMKYMTAAEEDILTNANYLKQGIAIDKLLQSMVVTKINFDDLLVGDKNAILIAARILGYGKDYEFSYQQDGEIKKGKIDLTTLKDKELVNISVKGTNEFNYKFPNSNNEVTFKLLTHGDEKKIEAEIKSLRKINPNSSTEVTTRLNYIITSVNGNREKEKIREFVSKHLLVKDSRDLRKEYTRVSPDIELKFYPEDGEEAVNVPIGASFFWPDSGV